MRRVRGPRFADTSDIKNRTRECRGTGQQSGARRAGNRRLEQLPHYPVGEVALQLAGPRAQSMHANRPGSRVGCADQPRLADPRRALHEQ